MATKLVIDFGMFKVGIKASLATSSKRVSFKRVNSKTNNLVGQAFIDKDTSKKVKYDDVLNGYEYEKDKVITFTDEELEKLYPKNRDIINVTEFVSVGKVDLIHIEQAYYISPDKGMSKGYSFIYKILDEHNKAIIGKWITKGKEYLVSIQKFKNGLIMYQMFYDTEIRAFDSNCTNVTFSKDEMKLGEVLVDMFTKPSFDRGKYSDGFENKIAVAAKVKLEGGNLDNIPSDICDNITDSIKGSLIAFGISSNEFGEIVSETSISKRCLKTG